MDARRQRKSEFAGVGCAIQAAGVLCLWFFPIGTLLGVVLLLLGSQLSLHWVCGNCKNKLGSKDVTVCPACHATLS